METKTSHSSWKWFHIGLF